MNLHDANGHRRNLEEALEGVDQEKRSTLARLITGTSFVAPLVASFTMTGMSTASATFKVSNGSGITVKPVG